MKRLLTLACLFSLVATPALAVEQVMFSDSKYSKEREAYISKEKLQKDIKAGYIKKENLGVGLADINGDGVKDLFVHDYNSFNCGSGGCKTAVYVNKDGKLRQVMNVNSDDTVGIGDKSSFRNGFHDIYLKGNKGQPIRWSYNGKEYVHNDR